MALRVSSALHRPGEAISFEQEVAIDPGRDDFTCEGEARVVGHMTGLGESVSIEGEVVQGGTACCSRCLATFSTGVTAPLDELYAREGDSTADEEEDADVRRFRGEWIDLAPAAQAALLLEMPMRFVCTPSCRGLCPTCGQNLNLGACVCPTISDDNPFSALKALLNADKEVDSHGGT